MVMLDCGPDYDLMWMTFDNQTGECWSWRNSDIKGVQNLALGRRKKAIEKPAFRIAKGDAP
jgi:hypothetical protein